MNQSDLIQAVSILAGIVPARPSRPVLSSILVVPSEAELTLTAFDKSIAYTTSVTGSHSLTMPCCVPGKLSESIISRIDGELELTQADETITIKSASGVYELRTLPADDYPMLPEVEDSNEISINADELLSAIKAVTFACSTDGHRLAVLKSLLDDSFAAKVECTIPGSALRELVRIVEKSQEPTITVKLSRIEAEFSVGADVFMTRLLDGQYPNYPQLIPNSFERCVTVDRKQLMNALERIAVLADQKNNIVKLLLDPKAQNIAVSVEASEVGSGREVVAAQITGDDLDIAFNVRYLLDGLKALGSNEVQLHCNIATSPAVLTPCGELQMTYLVMPVSLRN